ncbi:polysaccharide biosynthesis protein [Litchfieldia salsa]|uniref:Stage V sporulation protein B n=1 Tax=Litchfieldia salsa TaxID=930152 RepID=A0A1H0WKW3_9BACI|nr:polysaccharide biosynthesis protein [Litchfieldia salsa]SDP91253.1 stage V sporulation protein B [Litchfieldia salsa]
MSTFLKGTIVLILVAFIGECIEFLLNMVLAKELGEVGMGLYMTILPSIFLVVILASLELPISVSKLIAEHEQKYHRHMLQHIMKITIIMTTIFLLLSVLILPYVSVFDDYHPYVRWLVVALIPLISFTSIARGYFMGVQKMGKIAFSNFLRKAIQLILLVFIFQMFDLNLDYAILIALSTLVISDIFVFGYLIYEYIVRVRFLNRQPKEKVSKRTVSKQLMSVSIPTTGLRIFHSVTHAIQPFLIKAALIRAGMPAAVATEHYGLLAGVALTIGFFPAFIAHSLLIVLIPTVSEAYAKGDLTKLQHLLQKVLRFTMLYGVPAIAVFYFFAEPLTHLFFESTAATIYLQMLWPYFLFHFFVIPMQAYLIGLGLLKDAFFHTVWSHVIAFLVMFILGSLQQLRMEGIIIGMNMGAVLLTLMHYVTICKKIGLTVFLKIPIKTYN